MLVGATTRVPEVRAGLRDEGPGEVMAARLEQGDQVVAKGCRFPATRVGGHLQSPRLRRETPQPCMG